MVNALPHTWHLNGLSPVCVRMWICSADAELKGFMHTMHMCLEPERRTKSPATPSVTTGTSQRCYTTVLVAR